MTHVLYVLEETQISYTVIHDEARYSSSIYCNVTELRTEGQLIFYKEQPTTLSSIWNFTDKVMSYGSDLHRWIYLFGYTLMMLQYCRL
jgi:hypothetical protein